MLFIFHGRPFGRLPSICFPVSGPRRDAVFHVCTVSPYRRSTDALGDASFEGFVNRGEFHDVVRGVRLSTRELEGVARARPAPRPWIAQTTSIGVHVHRLE